ncbi:MAG: hypothetical protein AABZ77_00825 [Chloroflexota bacterium]
MTTCTTQKLTPNDGYSEALDYGRLEKPWRDWARIARSFAYAVDFQDRQDLMHNIIVRLWEVAEEYQRRGIPFHRGSCIKVAEYTRLRFYHQQKRWKRGFSISLNSEVRDEDGNKTELINTLLAQEGIDQDTWLDAKNHYQSSPKKVRQTIQKLLNENWRTLSGNDSKLIRRFREEAKQMAVATE